MRHPTPYCAGLGFPLALLAAPTAAPHVAHTAPRNVLAMHVARDAQGRSTHIVRGVALLVLLRDGGEGEGGEMGSLEVEEARRMLHVVRDARRDVDRARRRDARMGQGQHSG